MRKRIAIRVGLALESALKRRSKQTGKAIATVAVDELERALVGTPCGAEKHVQSTESEALTRATLARFDELFDFLNRSFQRADENEKARLQQILNAIKNGNKND